MMAPPKSTEKTRQYQLYTQNILRERRLQERLKEEELERSHEPNLEMKLRVQQAVGPIEPLEERIERLVVDKRQGLRRVEREKRQDLQRAKEKVQRRELLMEQVDSLQRARRRALFRVRRTLRDAGVDDVDCHFNDEELDDLERVWDENGL